MGDAPSTCRMVFDSQREPLETAAASLGEWEIHLGAMNQLVVGAITLSQAKQFWNQTRNAASASLAAFAAADDGYSQRTIRCPPPARSQPLGEPAESCQRGVAVRNQVLRLARVALRTWSVHVMHMEMLREGKMTPERATELWLQSWRMGQRQIDDYHRARATIRGAQC